LIRIRFETINWRTSIIDIRGLWKT
jgi:hypothetical protein